MRHVSLFNSVSLIGKIIFNDRISNEVPSSPDGAGFTGNERKNLQKAAENIFNF